MHLSIGVIYNLLTN